MPKAEGESRSDVSSCVLMPFTFQIKRTNSPCRPSQQREFIAAYAYFKKSSKHSLFSLRISANSIWPFMRPTRATCGSRQKTSSRAFKSF